MSSGCETAHGHSQSRCGQTTATRQVSITARTAGSLVSLWNASAVTAAVRSAHSAATAAAACQAAPSCRSGLSPVALTSPSSHPGGAVASRGSVLEVDELLDPGAHGVIEGGDGET